MSSRSIRIRTLLSRLLVGCIFLLAGCASAPPSGQRISLEPAQDDTGARIAALARQLVGTPYRRGGTGPVGFDCSGLVYYVHDAVGVRVPRRSRHQWEVRRPVPLSELRPGDVVFFRVSWRKVSHVGIYAGRGRFVHAPSSGKRVSISRLDNPYWAERLVGAGRLY